MRSLFQFLLHPTKMAEYTPPTDYERLASYERRLGEYKAQQWLRNGRIAQVFDARTAEKVRQPFYPRLPQDNVVQLRRKG